MRNLSPLRPHGRHAGPPRVLTTSKALVAGAGVLLAGVSVSAVASSTAGSTTATPQPVATTLHAQDVAARYDHHGARHTVRRTWAATKTRTSTAPSTRTSTSTPTAPTSSRTTSKPTVATTPPPTTGSAPHTGFPNAANTGPTVALKALPRSTTFTGWKSDASGNVRITASGAVVNGYDIPGAVYNDSHSFTLSNSLVRCANEGSWCVDMGGGSSLVTDTEIGGGATGTSRTSAIGILGYGSGANRIIRTDIHHLMHGIRLDGAMTLQDSWIHDLPLGDRTWDNNSNVWRTDLHSDSTMTQRGTPVVRHNTLEGGNTAAFFVQPDVDDSNAKVTAVTVDANNFVSVVRNGQMPTWGVLIESKGGRTTGSIKVTNNVFSKSGWEAGPMSIQVAATVSGNTYTDGTPVK